MVEAWYQDDPFEHTKCRLFIGEKNASKELLAERDLHRDLTILDIEENMNRGKTYEWFKHAYNNNQRDKFAHYLVFKSDMDTIACLHGFVGDLLNATQQSESKYLYYGVPLPHCYAKGCKAFEGQCWHVMAGRLYGLSMPLMEAIFDDDRASDLKRGKEDVQTAKWINKTSVREEVDCIDREEGAFACHRLERIAL